METGGKTKQMETGGKMFFGHIRAIILPMDHDDDDNIG